MAEEGKLEDNTKCVGSSVCGDCTVRGQLKVLAMLVTWSGMEESPDRSSSSSAKYLEHLNLVTLATNRRARATASCIIR